MWRFIGDVVREGEAELMRQLVNHDCKSIPVMKQGDHAAGIDDLANDLLYLSSNFSVL